MCMHFSIVATQPVVAHRGIFQINVYDVLPSVYMVWIRTSVDFDGPPLVNTWTVSNTWKERMPEITTTKVVTGPSIGQVTSRNRAQPLEAEVESDGEQVEHHLPN